MAKLTAHWTEASIDDFVYKIAADFVQQVENYLDRAGATQTELAEKLGVSPGRVSQVLNNPGNLTLRKIVEYTRALGKKVAVVAYDDNDPMNLNGPINSQVFERCWVQAGTPADFFALQDADTISTYVISVEASSHVPLPVVPTAVRANTANSPLRGRDSAGTNAENHMRAIL